MHKQIHQLLRQPHQHISLRIDQHTLILIENLPPANCDNFNHQQSSVHPNLISIDKSKQQIEPISEKRVAEKQAAASVTLSAEALTSLKGTPI
ncbi:hypothetical protein CEXT_40431 [Caerostris extrusa]|uniref:Uncharacterized protein n=1 Tax=Caerostris extrusa TaxID=172846 RepID=A0AAV4YB54_CAEEX|nr:hypothetical protein CEXT_40431 [Caerostris extrusa]